MRSGTWRTKLYTFILKLFVSFPSVPIKGLIGSLHVAFSPLENRLMSVQLIQIPTAIGVPGTRGLATIIHVHQGKEVSYPLMGARRSLCQKGGFFPRRGLSVLFYRGQVIKLGLCSKRSWVVFRTGFPTRPYPSISPRTSLLQYSYILVIHS